MDLYSNVNREQEQGDCYATVNKNDRKEDKNICDEMSSSHQSTYEDGLYSAAVDSEEREPANLHVADFHAANIRNDGERDVYNHIKREEAASNKKKPSINFQGFNDFQDSYKKNISNPWMWISITALLLAIIAIGIAAAGFANKNDLLKSDEDVKFLLTWKLYNGSIYRLTPNKQSWDKSQKVCESYGAHLATSIVDYCLPLKLIPGYLVSTRAWVGFSEDKSNNVWVLIDGKPTNSKCWVKRSHILNETEGNLCATTVHDHNYKLLAVSCSKEYFGLCEKKFDDRK